ELGEWEADRLRVPVTRGPFHGWPAWIAEPEELRDLVEGLPRRIVPRLPDQAVAERRLACVEGSVAAGYDEGQERRLQRRVGQAASEDVPLQMVDPDEGQPVGVGEGLGGRQPDEERAHEPGPVRHRQAVEVPQAHAGLAERLLNDR